jgi:Flp pilus assembly pilin Flp
MMMKTLRSLLLDDKGQDLIEYALLTATLALVVAAFLPPQLMPAVSSIFSKITSIIGIANS